MMGKVFLVISIFTLFCLVCHGFLKGFVRNRLGADWLKSWGNRLYYGQGILFFGTIGTALVLYLLKVSNILNF